MTTLLLIHGGLWEEGMDAGRFWHQPGIVAGLQDHGFEVLAPSRPHQAPDWATEARQLGPALPGPPPPGTPPSIPMTASAWPGSAPHPTSSMRCWQARRCAV
jgi:hypothetical protein